MFTAFEGGLFLWVEAAEAVVPTTAHIIQAVIHIQAVVHPTIRQDLLIHIAQEVMVLPVAVVVEVIAVAAVAVLYSDLSLRSLS